MWQFRTGTGDEYASLMNDEGGFVFYGAEPSDEQGAILAEALNVHEATGLTPSQLQARVAELEAALRDLETAK